MFIVTTIFFIIGNAALAFLLFMSIQKDQLFDKIFNWQKMLRNFDLKGTTKGWALSKFLGYCELCFAHFISFIGFWFYLILVLLLDSGFKFWFIWVIWYFLYVPTTTILSLYFIKKLFQNGSDNRGNNAENIN